MEIKIEDKQGFVTISLNGRLDTAVAAQVQQEINEKLAELPRIMQLMIDASELDYISSSGLRIVLSLKKKYPSLVVDNAQPSVYHVFDITGFTKIITVKKGLRKISIEGCEEIGRGGVGVVYRLTDDSIVKVFREGTTMFDVNREVSMAKEAFILGMPTAISYDIVNVGNQLGLVYELLNAETLSTCIKRQPERATEFAQLMGHIYKRLHEIQVDEVNTNIPNAHYNDRVAIIRCSKYYEEEDVNHLLYILDSIPQGHCLLHCDLHPKNVMMQNGEPMLIDMGEVGYGNPIIEIGHAYSTFCVDNFDDLVGFQKELAMPFWNTTMVAYFADKTPEERAIINRKIEVASIVRKFNWLALSDSFPKELIDDCKRKIKAILSDNWDEIKAICDTGLTF